MRLLYKPTLHLLILLQQCLKQLVRFIWNTHFFFFSSH